jgi:hypothetical protein
LVRAEQARIDEADSVDGGTSVPSKGEDNRVLLTNDPLSILKWHNCFSAAPFFAMAKTYSKDGEKEMPWPWQRHGRSGPD